MDRLRGRLPLADAAMRLLFVSSGTAYPLSLTGGARVTHDLLCALAAEAGVECRAVSAQGLSGAKDRSYLEWYPSLADFEALGVHEVRLRQGRWHLDLGYPLCAAVSVQEAFSEALDDFSPTVVYAQGRKALPLLREALGRGVPALWYLHGVPPLIDPGLVRSAAAAGVRLLCCSRFAHNRLRESAGVDAEVLYPFVAEEDYRVSRAGVGWITMFNPVEFKGLETVLRLAPRLPEERFLVVESWFLGAARDAVRKRLESLPNVRFQPRIPDVREVFRQTEILLAPSVGPEAAGRVVLEAQASGIPALVSDCGGLPEMVGEGGLVIRDYLDPEAWVAAIRRLRREPGALARLGEAALRHLRSEGFAAAAIVRRFHDICREVENAALPVSETGD
jgi:glycosyltransferase involved in cell wall biosynthesis